MSHNLEYPHEYTAIANFHKTILHEITQPKKRQKHSAKQKTKSKHSAAKNKTKQKNHDSTILD